MDRAERVLRAVVSDLRRRPERYRLIGLDGISEIVGVLLDASEMVTESDLTQAIDEALVGLGSGPHTHEGYASTLHAHLHNHDGDYSPLLHSHNYADPVHTHDYAASAHTHAAGDATTLDGIDSTGFALVGHTHGGVPPVVVRKTADQSNSSGTVLADVTGLTFPVAANTAYVFEFHLFVVAQALTTGLVVSVNGPLLPTHVRFGAHIPTTATAFFSGGATAYDTALVSTATPSLTVPHLTIVRGVLENGINAGTLALRMRSEVNGSSVTIQRGSWGRLQTA
jgi:hypothetical protein